MQAPLAILGFLLGLAAWWQTGQVGAIGAVAMIANWPFTFFAIMPVKHRLMAIEPSTAGPETRAMIERWGLLHAGRTALGLAASLAFLWDPSPKRGAYGLWPTDQRTLISRSAVERGITRSS
jgi:hypothetical protein